MVYNMVSTPGAIAVSTPAEVMVASAVLVTLHEPPGIESVYMVNEVAQIELGPSIIPGTGNALIATVLAATATPQLLVSV
jgi:hypothetical protein